MMKRMLQFSLECRLARSLSCLSGPPIAHTSLVVMASQLTARWPLACWCRFVPDKGFKGADPSRQREGPVQFEKDEDLFGLNKFMEQAKQVSVARLCSFKLAKHLCAAYFCLSNVVRKPLTLYTTRAKSC